jgi:translocation and assembly module TamB
VEGETIKVRRRWLPRWARVALPVVLLLLIIAFAIVWTLRVRIATDFIDRELASRGVQATYEVKRIGFGTQIFENLRLGDPARPDLVAREVRVQILIGFSGPYVGLITARGVRMRGAVIGGKLTLGQIDRLLPPPSGEPFRLPDQRVDLADVLVDLTTPAGPVALALDGRGNLSDGFRGRLGIRSPGLRLGDCALAGPVARFAISVADQKPNVSGPAAIRRVACGDSLAAERPVFVLRAALSEGLDTWRGTTVLRAAEVRASGNRLSRIQGRLGFDGNANLTRGDVEIEAGAAAREAVRAARTHFAGRYAVSPRRGDLGLQGALTAENVTAGERALASLAGSLRGTRGTPVGPIGNALADALLRAGRGGAEARAEVRLLSRNGRGMLRLGPMRLDSASGARLELTGGQGLAYAWPNGVVGLDGDFRVSGGGFPEARFALRPDGRAIRGRGRIAPMQAGGARLALGEISFAAGADGRTRFRTTALLDGPFSGGRVAGLSLPLTGRFGRGGFALGETCVTAAFQALQLQNLRIGPSRLPVCPVGGALIANGRFGAELRAPRLAGRLGSSPIALAASRVRVDSAGFNAAALSVRLGPAGTPNKLDIASLTGRFGARGVAGDFAGLAGDLANVPLLVTEGQGTWQMPGGNLSLAGRVTVSDKQDPARFTPLASEDFRLSLVDNRIRATGTLAHPASGARVALVTIQHDLGSGVGNAVLDVPELRFAEGGLQPEALTPLTVGVVALVDGALTGQGRIEWSASGTRSTGTFTTADLDLAAPFGPVEGLSTRIEFTDLLGLTSAPGQEAQVRVVHTGIDVFDGSVRYQLRPNYHVAVETARWPLAGGILTVEPTVLDFSRETVKYLTFRIDGLDAARFIQQMEFSNIAATGTFDGTIPMQFTQAGGRVVNGTLVARDGGGTLSYIGEVSDENLGAYGRLTFDALKSMRYSRMRITLDGSLDGEFLTRIDMDGIARNLAGTRAPQSGIAGMVVGRVLNQLARVPFHFNIRIEGPFRALVATGRSFSDPSDLIRASLPGLLENQTPPDNPIQPQESEPVP